MPGASQHSRSHRVSSLRIADCLRKLDDLSGRKLQLFRQRLGRASPFFRIQRSGCAASAISPALQKCKSDEHGAAAKEIQNAAAPLRAAGEASPAGRRENHPNFKEVATVDLDQYPADSSAILRIVGSRIRRLDYNPRRFEMLTKNSDCPRDSPHPRLCFGSHGGR